MSNLPPKVVFGLIRYVSALIDLAKDMATELESGRRCNFSTEELSAIERHIRELTDASARAEWRKVEELIRSGHTLLTGLQRGDNAP